MREELSLAPFCRKSPRAPVTGMTWLPLSAGAADQDLNPGAGFRGRARLHSCSDNSRCLDTHNVSAGPLWNPKFVRCWPCGYTGLERGDVFGGGGTGHSWPIPSHSHPSILAHKDHCTGSTPASRVCPPQRSLKDRSRTTGVSKHFLRLLHPAPGFCGL